MLFPTNFYFKKININLPTCNILFKNFSKILVKNLIQNFPKLVYHTSGVNQTKYSDRHEHIYKQLPVCWKQYILYTLHFYTTSVHT